MRCLLHRFGKWEDVDVTDEARPVAVPRLIVVRKVIKQQRRCSRCNLVQTRSS